MKQIRFIPNDVCGLRVAPSEDGNGDSRIVVGKPIIFGVRSVNLTPRSSTRVVYEILEPGCISNDLLQRSDVILNINHSSKVTDVFGRCQNGNGTLSLGLREDHVEAECDLPRTNAANDTLELIRRGDISGMSFAFDDDDWEDSENGVSYERTDAIEDGKEVWVRHVKRITALYDVSIVTHPAYEQTSVGTREVGDAILKRIDEQLQGQAATPDNDEAERARLEKEQKDRESAMATERLKRMRRRMNENIESTFINP